MRVAVVGGKLQGVEAAYLARKAGWEVVLLDKNKHVPAAGLCDVFCQVDITKARELPGKVKGASLLIPAVEDPAVLEHLKKKHLSGRFHWPLTSGHTQ